VSALKLRFGDESPSEASKLHEQQLLAALQRTGPPRESIESIVCRKSVCRISWRWKAAEVIPFYQAVGVLRRGFDPNLAIDAAKPANTDDARTIEIYLEMAASEPVAQ
jgi:hypothetical protein